MLGLRTVASFVTILRKCNKYEAFWAGLVVRLFNELCTDCKEKLLLRTVGSSFYALMIVLSKAIDRALSVLRLDHLWIIFRLM